MNAASTTQVMSEDSNNVTTGVDDMFTNSSSTENGKLT